MNKKPISPENKTRMQAVLEKELEKWPTQKALAIHLGITPPFLNQLLKGKASGERSLIDIAEKLGISPLDLMDNIKLVPEEKLDLDDRIPVYTVSEFIKKYGTKIVTPPARKAETEGGEGMEILKEEREWRVGILLETNLYEPFFKAGDIIITDPSILPSVGDICLVILGDDPIFRKLAYQDESETRFSWPNDEGRQEVLKSSSPIRLVIWGKVTSLRREI